jgi:hypothetical protein
MSFLICPAMKTRQRSSSWLRWFRQAGAVLFCIFIIGIFDRAEAAFRGVPDSTEPCFSDYISPIGVPYPAHCVKFYSSISNINPGACFRRGPIQTAQCAAFSSFHNDDWILPSDLQFVVRWNHWQRRFAAMENTADKFDVGRSCSDIGQIKMATKLLASSEGNEFAVHDIFLKSRLLPNNNLANDDLWSLRRKELFTSEVNRLTRQPSLYASTDRQDNREGRNNDGSDGGSEFRRPIHWDSFTFYTTLGGLLSFAASFNIKSRYANAKLATFAGLASRIGVPRCSLGVT